ncbi:6b521abe-38bd-4a16-8ac0-d49076d4659c [Thermothielavioides terrestris]|uniref:1,3-beta-glucanosyltransferase n=2 Tax=Thermothielavioides terrestris TaxID=2587410 RepID=G2RFY8_THETT|nr:glycoside hydrolase family 72 protein [Thermothielavioides terrestris NRRL 8126]AEO71742.1 glycoside hydrolase family 72 protein [Thermothielavioides terrestris NRRL 8126]SPQ27273.1 6b521abe-38bd-4a16-8ac0-d49076d4659c [Thermothielavioides terrestris]
MLLHSALLALGATLAAAVQPLEVKDQYFVNPKTGNRFQIVGVAYQPGGSAGYDKAKGRDPLSDPTICLRDAALLQMLGVNTIRVYNVNPDVNHDECASIFNAAGMYMILDVNSPLVGESLTSDKPWESYYAAYLNRTFAVVEAFKNYPNTLAFFSGNEVINNVETGATVPPYMRAVTRDIKNYVKKHTSRPIPVGYSAADVRSILFDTYHYFQCALEGDDDNMSMGDIFALNSYSWCGDSNFHEASYDQLVSGFTGNSVPIFFSEYGCNTPSPRVFTEVPTIYGPQMTGVFSGGLVYEYTEEPNNYGLVNMSSTDDSAILLGDFVTLHKQYAKLNFTEIQGQKPGSSSASKPPVCSSKLITTAGFNNNFTLPSPPPGAQDIIDHGVKPTPSGKLVDIKDWTVKVTVKNVDGSVITNLAVKPLGDDDINHPGTVTDVTDNGTSTGTSTAAAATTSEDAAPRSAAVVLPAVAMGALAVVAGYAI